jgi:hypothetical protein
MMRIGAAISLLICVSAAVRAEDPAAPDRPMWGTQDRILTHIGFSEFTSYHADVPYAGSSTPMGRYSTAPGSPLMAVAHVPSGALLTYLELDYCDNSASANVALYLRDCSYLGTDCHLLTSLSSGNGLSGCHLVSTNLTNLGYTMDNNARQLVLEALTIAGDFTTLLTGAYIGYRLQISPAPAHATFADVPASHLYFRAIEALTASGIAGGCGGGNFCPNQNVTRGEMAAFLARALGLHFAN